QIYFSVVTDHREKKLTLESFEQFDEFTNSHSVLNFPRYRYYYHILVNLKANQQKDTKKFFRNSQDALHFFDNYNFSLPAYTRFIFLINLIPILIEQKKYHQVEGNINACLSLIAKGDTNWHSVMLYKALYGFQTNKPSISLAAWKKAQKYLVRKDKTIIDRWLMIGGFLAFYHQIGRLHFPKEFRLWKFVNTISQGKRDYAQKANVLCLELIHTLTANKLSRFTDKVLTLDSTITRYFRGKSYNRTKYFLKCMQSVLKGNFTANGAKRHATLYAEKLLTPPSTYDLNRMEKEMVPYDLLWQEIIRFLQKK
ncbi:MAG: hypothetical protein AAF960_12910, partial [Bacteroidota bacterium]